MSNTIHFPKFNEAVRVQNAEGKVVKSNCYNVVEANFPIPEWVATGEHPGVCELASVLKLAGIEDGEWVRLSAADQRKLLGFAFFGKKAFCIEGSTVRVAHTVAFGRDWEISEYHGHQLDEAVREAKSRHEAKAPCRAERNALLAERRKETREANEWRSQWITRQNAKPHEAQLATA